MNREEVKSYNALVYVGERLKLADEVTDRIFNIFEKIKICKNCQYFKQRKDGGSCSINGFRVIEKMSCNKWIK